MSMRKAGTISKTSQTVKEEFEEVIMDTNQAYETVEMRYRYQSASENQPPVGLQEQNTTDSVYENH